MNNLKEKLSNLTSDRASDWKAKAKYRRENREWLRKSAAIPGYSNNRREGEP
jgi:hypothetical protein